MKRFCSLALCAGMIGSLLGLSACGGSGGGANAAERLVGTWLLTQMRGYMAGTPEERECSWTFTVQSDLSYTGRRTDHDTTYRETGTITLDGDYLTFHYKIGRVDHTYTATYQYYFADGGLVLDEGGTAWFFEPQ